LLKNHTFSLKPLASAGHLDILGLLGFMWQPAVIFTFAVGLQVLPLRFVSEGFVTFMLAVGLICLLAAPTVAACVLLVGIIATKLHSRVRSSAVVFWAWWPSWLLVLCWSAAAAGLILGDYLWHHQFLPYQELTRLQSYAGVDPFEVHGDRVQDAGLITFANNVSVDRAQGGCLMNGDTYCVAPVVRGGRILPGDANLPAAGSYDFFVVGTNCCPCPNTNFRCGMWNQEGPVGGLRVVDQRRIPFYRLAAANWGAQYGKTVSHPVFFEWVQSPLAVVEMLHTQGTYAIVCAFALVTVFSFCAAVVLNGLLQVLVGAELAAPIDAPDAPPSKVGRALFRKMHPRLHAHHQELQSQVSAKGPTYVTL